MRLAFISLIICSLFATGCSWVKFPGVRKVEIQQGNIVDQEMIDKLRPGMTQSPVQFVLGTPKTVAGLAAIAASNSAILASEICVHCALALAAQAAATASRRDARAMARLIYAG